MGNSLKLYADKHKQYITIIMIGLDKTEETHWNYMKNYDNSFFALPYKHKSFKELWKATGQSLGGSIQKVVEYLCCFFMIHKETLLKVLQCILSKI